LFEYPHTIICVYVRLRSIKLLPYAGIVRIR